MFGNNIKFTRAVCWIDSKLSNRDKNFTLIIFVFCHCCWSLLWCYYWKSLKSDSHHQETLLYLLQWKNPLKMMKNAYYFISKTLLVVKIFKFLCWLFGRVKNGLIRKIRLTSKLMTMQPGLQTIAINIFSNISQSIGY